MSSIQQKDDIGAVQFLYLLMVNAVVPLNLYLSRWNLSADDGLKEY